MSQWYSWHVQLVVTLVVYPQMSSLVAGLYPGGQLWKRYRFPQMSAHRAHPELRISLGKRMLSLLGQLWVPTIENPAHPGIELAVVWGSFAGFSPPMVGPAPIGFVQTVPFLLAEGVTPEMSSIVR